MAQFESIIQWILYQEDDKRIPGKTVDLGDGAGLTRFGLTQRWHQSELPITFFSTLPFKDAVTSAKIVYRNHYWNFLDGDLISADKVAASLMSFAVNDTVSIAVKTLQSVLDVDQDGHMGPKTLAELNSKDPDMVVKLFRAGWIEFYQQDARINPSKARFLEGWINRANFSYPYAELPSIYE